MKSNMKAKLMLIFLCSLISLSFVFGSNIVIYPAKLSENPVNTSEQNVEKPHSSTNGAFKIYYPANGTALTDIDDFDYQGNTIISDGEGGAIIAYWSVANNDIYAQKITSNGDLPWGLNGVVICNASGIQDWVTLCTDDAGGAIIAWTDNRVGTDIYAQHINSTGHTQWGESWWSPNDRNGTVICNATDVQLNPQICKDGAKGAIIAWEDERNPTKEIYAQRVDSNGITHWGESWWSPNDRNGTVICNATIFREEIRICSDESKGAILTWYDRRTGTDCIYAQRVDSEGNTQWGESWWGGPNDRNGTVICNHTSWTNFPQICKDGANGAIIAWTDNRVGTDIYAQRVDSDGKTHWGESWWSGPNDRNGTVICDDTDSQDYVYLCEDGAGGALLTWEDGRGTDDVYAQRVDSDGNTHWGDGKVWVGKPDRNGTLVCNALGNQDMPQICADGTGGAILVWSDYRHGFDDHIYVQRVSSDGTTHWGDGKTWGGNPDRNGTAIFNVAGVDGYTEDEDPEFSNICSDDNGGAIIFWGDERNAGSNFDLFAQRVRGAILPTGGGVLPAGDDDDDDDEDTGMVVVVVVIIIIACVGGVVVVVIVLIKKGVIGTSRG